MPIDLKGLVLAYLALVASGCTTDSGRPTTYAVSGTVTLKNVPVEGAQIVFVPTGTGEAASATSDAAGKYQLTTFEAGDGALPGDYRVKVMKYDVPKPRASGGTQTLEEEQNLPFTDDRPAPTPPKNLLPKKYESEITSGIVHTVTTAPTTLDIKIE